MSNNQNMDRFKFRVFHKPTGKLFYVYSFSKNFVRATESLVVVSIKTFLMSNCELEQCTGLKDKNGKLIYEGDIILVDDDKCPVEWDSENARYNVVGYGEIAYLYYNDIEIIGNIHENADLLGEE